MTVACGGGTSAPKPATELVVTYTAGLLAAIFAAYDLAWLIPVIPFVGLAPLTLSSFCGSDPPALPTFSSAESDALLQLKFGPDFDSGVSKLRDLALNTIWYDACQCTSGTQVPLAPPAPPAGTPIPIYPSGSGVQACQRYQTTQYIAAGGPLFIAQMPPLPAGATSIVINVSSPPQSAAQTISFEARWVTAANVLISNIGQQVLQANNGATLTRSALLTGAPHHIEARITSAGNVGQTYQCNMEILVYCNGDQPGPGSTPCCPPDTATLAYLDNIHKLVTLIQRQMAPFAYISSTAHATLAGAGSFAIQGLLGVKVNVTTLPASLGVSGTSPAEHFDLGFITFGTADGYPHSIRLEHQVQLMLPARASVFTTLAYDLHPGVVVTITELLREP